MVWELNWLASLERICNVKLLAGILQLENKFG